MKSRLSTMLESKRNEKKITKKQAACLIGITPMYYARFENDNLFPTKRNLSLFAKFLDVSEDELWKIVKEDKKN